MKCQIALDQAVSRQAKPAHDLLSMDLIQGDRG